jgi:hypothetical protein
MSRKRKSPRRRLPRGSEEQALSRLAELVSRAPDENLPNSDPRYLVPHTERFWTAHLTELVNDTLTLGLAREDGLSVFGDLMRKAFGTTAVLFSGYLQLAGHVNNLVLAQWMPLNKRPAAKVEALIQLHGRSLVLAEEIMFLTFRGYPSGANAIARTLHEVRVTARFLHRFEAHLSERYLASHIVELWKTRADWTPSGAARRSKAWKATELELEQRYQRVLQQFGESMTIENGWAFPRFAKRLRPGQPGPRRIPFSRIEEEVRRPFDRERYRHGSQQIHASHLGGIRTLYSGEQNVALLGPRPQGLARAAEQAMWDVQDVAESLLRSSGRFSHDATIYYWLEALDQQAYMIRGSIQESQSMLDNFFKDREKPSE